MSFRKPCHMPFHKLIPPFTLTEKKTVVCQALFYLKYLKFTCLEKYLLAYFGSTVKTINVSK